MNAFQGVSSTRILRLGACLWVASLILALPAQSQSLDEEKLAGPDAHETGEGTHKYLLGDWGGERERLLKRGVKFDLHYISDSLWNAESTQKEQFSSFNRFRGTVDLDLGSLVHLQDLSFHATAVWQAGGNIGSYLGLISNPAGLASMNTFRLDSWWFEKRLFNEHLALRVGQFAGQDSYGDQVFGTSYVFEPLADQLDNLGTDFESFDPPSTPALEVRVVPMQHFYVKSMVLAEDRMPFANNPTGLVPQFRGVPVSVSEIGFTPGKKAVTSRAADSTKTREGYSGVYRFGASYNPGKFTEGTSGSKRSGNYLLYWMANQAIWRLDPKEAKGLDATFAYDWSPADINRQNQDLTAGLRFNEPFPLKIHNTMSVAFVQSNLSSKFRPLGTTKWKPERGAEFNLLLNVRSMIILQPAIQYYENVGGGVQRAVVIGFRTKVEF